MRRQIAVRFAFAIATVAAVATGCSSAPEEATRSSDDSLTTVGGGIVHRPPFPLPTLVCSAPAIDVGCQAHLLQGYNVAMPANATSCPTLYLPGNAGYWTPVSWAPGGASYPVPGTGEAAGTHVCTYLFSNTVAYNGGVRGFEHPTLDQMCSILNPADIDGISYVLPAEVPATTSPWSHIPLPSYVTQVVSNGSVNYVCQLSTTRVARPIGPVGTCDTCLVTTGGGTGTIYAPGLGQ